MNAERLLDLYDRISEAPDAIARLRRFVLDLAVRGKLVEQDPGDEPATALLRRIATEKARLGVKLVPAPVGGDEVPFGLPKGWCWTRVGEVCSKTGSGSTPRGGKEVYRDSGVPFLRSQNVHNDGVRLDDVAFIDLGTHARMAGTRVLSGDLLLNITGGSMGRCARVSADLGEANVSQHVAIIRPAVDGMDSFLHCLILSPYFQGFIFDEQTGAGRGGLPKNRMDRIVIALPPLAEQHRIVAKVDELMALCDRLEEARKTREETRDRLTAASLARLTAPDTTDQDFPTHARFALDTLPPLTHRPDQIKSLRQTILHLAVRGKLVAQDPGDEPASALLKRIAAEKVRLVSSGVVKADRATKDPVHNVELFDLPQGWAWANLLSLCISVTDGDHQPPPKADRGIPFLVIGDVRTKSIRYDVERSVPREYYDALDDIRKPRLGDLLYTLVGSFGIPVPVRGNAPFCVQRHIGIIRPSAHMNVDALALLLESAFVFKQAEAAATGIAQKTVPLAGLRSLVIPVPPFAEQRRIVAKVNELMALCDRLEAAIATADTTRARLLEALLHEALEPAEDVLEAAE